MQQLFLFENGCQLFSMYEWKLKGFVRKAILFLIFNNHERKTQFVLGDQLVTRLRERATEFQFPPCPSFCDIQQIKHNCLFYMAAAPAGENIEMDKEVESR